MAASVQPTTCIAAAACTDVNAAARQNPNREGVLETMTKSRLARSGSRIGLAAVVMLIAAITIAGVSAKADVWNKKTVLTVREPIQVQETYLEPGTYVMKLHDSSSNRHIVHIFNGEENRVIDTIMAIPTYRARPADGTQFTFHETPAGTVKAMRTWHYPGDTTGREFRYPKHLRQIAMATPPRLVELPVEPAPEPVITQPEEPEPAPMPQAYDQEPAREEPELMARAEPAPEPEPQAPVDMPEPAQEAQPTELPSTATWFPLAGLGGLLALAGFGLLQMNRRG
jgi:hypothetical protein